MAPGQQAVEARDRDKHSRMLRTRGQVRGGMFQLLLCTCLTVNLERKARVCSVVLVHLSQLCENAGGGGESELGWGVGGMLACRRRGSLGSSWLQ